jgi:hypothetical protein
MLGGTTATSMTIWGCGVGRARLEVTRPPSLSVFHKLHLSSSPNCARNSTMLALGRSGG